MKELLAIVTSVGLLAGVTVERLSFLPPQDVGPYHARVREVAQSAPMFIGAWRGKEAPIPPAAVQLLKPNVLISRQFHNAQTGQSAALLLVQCDDTRELVAHYPPVCYPGRGYRVLAETPRTLRVGGLDVPWTQYEFTRQGIENFSSLIVAHFIVMPDGQIRQDMDAMRSSAARVQDRFYGAAQVQVVMDGSIPAAQRDEIFKAIVGGNAPLIEAIRSGVKR